MDHNQIDIQKVIDDIRADLIAFKQKAVQNKGNVTITIQADFDGRQFSSVYTSIESLGRRRKLI